MAMLTIDSKAKTRYVKSGYAPVNGLKLYYEIHGTGRPLILLHGGVGASEMFEPVLPALTGNRQIIAVHLQAHGQTADIDRPLSFQSMADDIAALIKHLDLEKADILGYSLGGGVALQTSIRHPNRVRKLVIISAPFKRHGFYPEVLENMAQMGPESAKFMNQSPLYTLYPNVDWAMLFTKLGVLLKQDYDWSKDVAALKSPMLIVAADADAVQTAHLMDFYALLGGGQRDAGMDGSGRPAAWLAILPGMTHYDILTFPSLASIVTRFLDSPIESRQVA
jgi:pimeloyl-ACP methyl ester carboxylesterase